MLSNSFLNIWWVSSLLLIVVAVVSALLGAVILGFIAFRDNNHGAGASVREDFSTVLYFTAPSAAISFLTLHIWFPTWLSFVYSSVFTVLSPYIILGILSILGKLLDNFWSGLVPAFVWVFRILVYPIAWCLFGLLAASLYLVLERHVNVAAAIGATTAFVLLNLGQLAIRGMFRPEDPKDLPLSLESRHARPVPPLRSLKRP